MKDVFKTSRKSLLSVLLGFVILLSFAIPVFAEGETAAALYGTVEALTAGLTAEGDEAVTVTNSEELTLDFVHKDESIGRNNDGWWAGVKVTAPEGLDTDALADVKYRYFGASGWGDDRSFSQDKDTADDAQVQYITAWILLTPENTADAENGIFTRKYMFDWDKNGFDTTVQTVTINIDTAKLKFIHSEGCTKVVDVEAKEPGCNSYGNTEGSHCSVCGLVINKSQAILSLGHDFTEKVIDEKHLAAEKTCGSHSKYFYECSRCDELSSDTFENTDETLPEHEKIRKLDKIHLISAADCENPAKYYMGCRNCDTVFKDETFTDGTPKYHLFISEKVTKKATFKKDGYTNFYCEDCGKLDNQPIPFAGIEKVTISGTSYKFTGKAITPAVTVKDSTGKILKNGTDYTVKYTNNTAPGTATATVTFIGKYTGTQNFKFTIGKFETAKNLAFTSTVTTVKLSWSKVSNVTGYKIYQKTSKGWKEVGSTAKTAFTVKKLTAGKRYTFMVKAYVTADGKTVLSDASKSIYTATKPAAIKKLSATQTVTSVTLKWSKTSGAKDYRVYKYNSKTKKYEFYKTVTGTKLTIKKLKSATTYKYLVKASTLTADKKKVYSDSKKISVTTKPAAATINVVTNKGTVGIQWKSIKGATGYQVYCKDAKTGKLQLISTVKAGKTSVVKSGFSSGEKYLFAVRAYKSVSGKRVYGDFGQKAVVMK